jgi:hypothetical protein
MAIFASVRNRSSSKFKSVRPSVVLEDRVILLNCIYNLIEQKVTKLVCFIAILKIKQSKVVQINKRKALGMSFTGLLPRPINLIITIESTYLIVTEFSTIFVP